MFGAFLKKSFKKWHISFTMLVVLSQYPYAITRVMSKEISRNHTQKNEVVSLNDWFKTL